MSRIVSDLEAVTRRVISGEAPMPSADEVAGIVTAAVRLYAAKAECEGTRSAPVCGSVSSTEVVVMATGLLKARDLNLFDLAVWFNRAP